METIVPDTSIIIDGKLTELAEKGRLRDTTLIISEAVLNELESQANRGKEIGYAGIEEVQELHDIAENQGFTVEYEGRRPTADEIEMAGEGRVDAMIRDIAQEKDGTLYTADYVQYKVAKAKGIEVKYFEQEEDVHFSIQDYFEDDIMSVHLKQDMPPMAKRGEPGEMEYVELDGEPLSKGDISRIAKETFEKAQAADDGLVEMNEEGATVVQIGNLRIAMSNPPFSERREITAVRPTIKVGIDDYDLSDKLKKRLTETAEGILIAGAPGHGKSTFAQALAEFYEDEGRVVKTMEHPRDLQVGAGVTQYSKLDEEFANTGDFLLLVRPDYTVYDEVRKTEDFEVFSDMRLAGVGMLGVVHASEALDAVQRLIGRVELGVIPQVVDTVVHIENAEVAKVYKLELTVKVPEGMTEADLARPVIQVLDFETDTPEHEIYTYGEETVVIPVSGTGSEDRMSPMEKFAAQQIEYELSDYINNPQVEITGPDSIILYVPENKMGQIIGHEGKQIDKIEERTGLNIEVRDKADASGGPSGSGGGDTGTPKGGEPVNYHFEEQGNNVVIMMDDKHAGEDANFYEGNEFLFTATIGKNGKMTMSKDTDMAGNLLGAHVSGDLRVYV